MNNSEAFRRLLRSQSALPVACGRGTLHSDVVRCTQKSVSVASGRGTLYSDVVRCTQKSALSVWTGCTGAALTRGGLLPRVIAGPGDN